MVAGISLLRRVCVTSRLFHAEVTIAPNHYVGYLFVHSEGSTARIV